MRIILLLSLITLSSASLLSISVAELSEHEKKIEGNTLYLSGKSLTSLEGLLDIQGIEEVKTLFLQSNQLEILPNGIFDRFVNLEILYLSVNRFRTFDEQVFTKLRKLKLLQLAINELNFLPPSIFNPLVKLEKLYLSNNLLHELPLLSNLTNLTELYLDQNNLTTLPESIKDLKKLSVLYLWKNELHDLPATIFSNFNNLTYLNLVENGITALAPEQFHNLVSLQKLFLNSNSLSSLPSGIFDDCTKLREIFLNENRLRTLPTELFTPLTHLRILFASDNRLSANQVVALILYCKNKRITLNIENQHPPLMLKPTMTQEQFGKLSPKEQEQECSICREIALEDEKFPSYMTQCFKEELEKDPRTKGAAITGHRFHTKCLEDWLNFSGTQRCPHCRRNIFTGKKEAAQETPVAQKTVSPKKNIHVATTTKKRNSVKVAQATKKQKSASKIF